MMMVIPHRLLWIVHRSSDRIENLHLRLLMVCFNVQLLTFTKEIKPRLFMAIVYPSDRYLNIIKSLSNKT